MIKIQKFEAMMDLEFDVQSARASVECQLAGVPVYQKQARMNAYRKALAALDKALDEALITWTTEELKAYGSYRAGVKARYAS